ncbi:NADH-quinone oxidoreductase subunit D [Thermodesulfovibrio aggregans]|uniref:NADH-quinone oxidoreductase subunit D n=1 Tax=Thermodesulfovibrio aggregans TaxID=86166 RepID=A0A0U9HT88_9BACT|nr:NADH-quinone oxidoreductase subunit D [Thermodesulfovibrio aggregans]GAQ95378.1 NADH-quinone oxidoreductase subunit D [Thermodesulfovibrio aggregans]
MGQLEIERVGETTFVLQMGPHHPATHGVLKLVCEFEGERVVKITPDVGYLHRGVEKLSESKTYAGAMTLTDRLDYISSMTNNIGYCVAVERLMGIEPPPRAKFIRTMVAELTRLSSHLLWLATHALDIGAMTVFLYAFREREQILQFFEKICGARLTVSYPRIGGVRVDIRENVLDEIYRFMETMLKRVDEYETLLTENRIWIARTKGIGVITAQEAVSLGLTGPALRGSGVYYDIRKLIPYDAYSEVDFEVPLGENGDTYDRYLCRIREMRQSALIVKQCIEKMPAGEIISEQSPDIDMAFQGKRKIVADDSLLSGFIKFIDEKQEIMPKGEIYSAIEAPKGELGFYIISDGSGRPYRMRVRAPSFIHISAIPELCEGHLLADVIAIIGTLDIVMGEADR